MCDELSDVRVFWPGREPLYMCLACAAKARRIGEAMGCYIHMEPTNDDIQCETKKG